MKSTSSRLFSAAIVATLLVGSAAPAFAQYRYHRHNNDAAGAAALGLLGGAVIGGIIASQPAYVAPAPAYAYPAPAYAYPSSNPHADWCAANTPGYSAYDNTYQGRYAGERILCRSPYGG